MTDTAKQRLTFFIIGLIVIILFAILLKFGISLFVEDFDYLKLFQ